MLRRKDNSWDNKISWLLHGLVHSARSTRYVSHFLSVHRVRPRDEDEEVRKREENIEDFARILFSSNSKSTRRDEERHTTKMKSMKDLYNEEIRLGRENRQKLEDKSKPRKRSTGGRIRN